ncbi:hypothetical protein NLU13_5499 [Sarocladium strictum]|uniref:Metaxin-1 n=1 Tax=Sarocladium strictum TaxID=5046 RepID=A0AA39GHC2_SARSR|nr:hypothetical protein NLU13_5499 [Sarocladium strictum]
MADTAATPTTSSSQSIFTIPQPIRSLFNRFPLQTYPPNSLPSSPSSTAASPSEATASPTLYIFASPSQPLSSPSPNPTCLKLQTYLLAAGVQHTCVSSTNHASPSGALPFLLLPGENSSSSRKPLTGGKIVEYAKQNARDAALLGDAEEHPKIEAYRSLISQAIRPAWLHDLYLVEANITLLKTIYLPSSPLTHPSLLHTLRTAATTEILQTTRRPILNPSLLHADAIAALRSLDALLGETTKTSSEKNVWFFGADAPSLFDAEVFAYTWLLLDDEGAMGGLISGVREELRGLQNLVRHRTALYDRCWGEHV